jgi:hypothetical protein
MLYEGIRKLGPEKESDRTMEKLYYEDLHNLYSLINIIGFTN